MNGEWTMLTEMADAGVLHEFNKMPADDGGRWFCILEINPAEDLEEFWGDNASEVVARAYGTWKLRSES